MGRAAARLRGAQAWCVARCRHTARAPVGKLRELAVARRGRVHRRDTANLHRQVLEGQAARALCRLAGDDLNGRTNQGRTITDAPDWCAAFWCRMHPGPSVEGDAAGCIWAVDPPYLT